MTNPIRHWTSWRRLPRADRPARLLRTAERWVRRSPVLRRFHLVRPGPRHLARAMRTDLDTLFARLSAGDGARGPLQGALDERAGAVARTHPDESDALLARAIAVAEGRIDLLGSGERRPLTAAGGLDWHRDWVSGELWPEDVDHTRQHAVGAKGSDVKLPWELSRAQHLLVLGQAHRLAPHRLGPQQAREARARFAAAARQQILDWIEHNPRGLGINWVCTMDVAIRAAVWTASYGLLRGAEELDRAFLIELVGSLWMHGRHIRRNLELRPDRPATNHYLADLAGLYAIACFLPELREAAEWRRRAWAGLEEQIALQVLDDGVSFERSIPYHRLATEILLHAGLSRVSSGEPLPAPYAARLERMLEFIATYTRPDGSVPQWGDNDDGRFLPLDGYASHEPHDHRHLLAWGGLLLGREDLAAEAGGRDLEGLWLLGRRAPTASPRPSRFRESRGFETAAYYVLRHDDLHASIPWGGVGTAGLGGHGHNDLGSLCVWAAGTEWIADPGTGVYTRDPSLRNRLRGTGAHATLQLGAREQNPHGKSIDDLFRLEEHARPAVGSWSADANGARLVASHRGFSRGAEEWLHARTVRFEASTRLLCVVDDLTLERGAEHLPLEPVHLRWPLSPRVEECHCFDWESREWPAGLRAALERESVGEPGALRAAARLESSGRTGLWIALALPPGSRVELVEAPFSPRYGVVVVGHVLTATLPPHRSVKATSVMRLP